jgi:hypothetical protein
MNHGSMCHDFTDTLLVPGTFYAHAYQTHTPSVERDNKIMHKIRVHNSNIDKCEKISSCPSFAQRRLSSYKVLSDR